MEKQKKRERTGIARPAFRCALQNSAPVLQQPQREDRRAAGGLLVVGGEGQRQAENLREDRLQRRIALCAVARGGQHEIASEGQRRAHGGIAVV